MQPKFEKTIDTVEDVLESDLNVVYPVCCGIIEVLQKSPNVKYQQLGKI